MYWKDKAALALLANVLAAPPFYPPVLTCPILLQHLAGL
jgi:hypothetical protein